MSDRSERYLRTLEKILSLSAVDLRTALTSVADLVAEVMGAEKVDVFVHDRASDTLVAEGTSDTPLGRKQRALGLDRLPVSNGGRAALVFQGGGAFLTGDAAADPDELRGIVEGLGIRSVLAVPFSFGEEGGRAVLLVTSTEKDRFDDADLSFASALARWVGAIGHRAALVERLTSSARQEGRQAAAEEIVTVVAHDLRNVLSPALGRVQLIRRRAQKDGIAAVLRDAEAAERALQRASRVVGDLLEVARIDQGLFELTPGIVELVGLLNEVARALAEPGREVAIRGPEELVVPGDAARLLQVFENLVANAVRHAPAGTTVTVDVAAALGDGKSEWAQVDVRNEGPPIPPELVPSLFGRYVHGKGSGGLGLGLHLAREIVLAHRGTIGVEPSRGGAHFRVRLPLHG